MLYNMRHFFYKDERKYQASFNQLYYFKNVYIPNSHMNSSEGKNDV